MRCQLLKVGILSGVLAFSSAGAFAQYDEHHPQNQPTQDHNTQPQIQSDQAAPNTPAGMGGGMMGMMMNTMMGQNQQLSDNMNKMMENMTSMQNEKDPAKMKSMMAEQSEMLEHMRTQMMQQGGMMRNMSGMMKSCPMAGTANQPASPKK